MNDFRRTIGKTKEKGTFDRNCTKVYQKVVEGFLGMH